MGVTFRAAVVLGVKFDESMIPRSLTHKTEAWVEYVCTKDKRHKASGDFCSTCGAPTAHVRKSEEVENEDFEMYEFERMLEEDAPSWGDREVLHTAGNSEWDDAEEVLGLVLVEDDDIIESGKDLRPFKVTIEAYREVAEWLQRHDIHTKPTLFLVTSCG